MSPIGNKKAEQHTATVAEYRKYLACDHKKLSKCYVTKLNNRDNG